MTYPASPTYIPAGGRSSSTATLRVRTRQRRFTAFTGTRCSSGRSTRVSRLAFSATSRVSSLAASSAASAACPSRSRPTSPRDSTVRTTPRYVFVAPARSATGHHGAEECQRQRVCTFFCSRSVDCRAYFRTTRHFRRSLESSLMRRCTPTRRSANLMGSDLPRKFWTRWRRVGFPSSPWSISYPN